LWYCVTTAFASLEVASRRAAQRGTCANRRSLTLTLCMYALTL
jgi:hypothetical protein